MDKVIVLSVCLAVLHSTIAQTVDKGNSSEVTVSVVPLVPAGESVDISNSLDGTSKQLLKLPPGGGIHLKGSHQDDNKAATIVDTNLVETGQNSDVKTMKTNILVNKKEQKAKSENATKQGRKSRKDKKRAQKSQKQQKKFRLAKMRALIMKRRRSQKAKRKAFTEAIRAAINNIIEHVNEAHKTCKGTEECNKLLRKKLFRLATIKPKAIAALAKTSKERSKTAEKRQLRLLQRKGKRPTALTSLKTELSTGTTPKKIELSTGTTSKKTELSTGTTPIQTEMSTSTTTKTTLPQITTDLTTKKSPALGKKGLKRRQMLQRMMRKRLMQQRMKKRQKGRKPSRESKRPKGGKRFRSRKPKSNDTTKSVQN